MPLNFTSFSGEKTEINSTDYDKPLNYESIFGSVKPFHYDSSTKKKSFTSDYSFLFLFQNVYD